nr:HVA22-like protein i [Tanacetum cinerariifolium]
MQLNSKFVNNILPEWSRFITEAKLNRGLRESNFDHLYAYLKQHEVHATENKMMLERFTQTTNDPLPLVSNTSLQQYPAQSSISSQSSHQPSPTDRSQNEARFTPTDYLIEKLHLTQGIKLHFKMEELLFRIIVVDAMQIIKEDSFRGTMQEDLLELEMLEDSDYFKDKMMLMQAQENGQDLALNVDHVFEADQCDAFDSDVMLMRLLRHKPHRVYEHHDVHEMQNNVQQDYVADFDANYTSDSNIIIYDQYVEDNAEQDYFIILSSTIVYHLDGSLVWQRFGNVDGGGGLIIYRNGLPNNGGLPYNNDLPVDGCLEKDNGENIMKSIIEGPYQMGTKTVTLAGGVEGVFLLGLLKDIYTPINHYTDAKDIWDYVKMLLEGSKLTKDDRQSQLYDDFEHFRQNKGETIHYYYVRTSSNTRNKATVQDRRFAVQDVRGRYNVNNQGRQFQRNNARGFLELGMLKENGVVLDEEQLLFLAGEQVTNFDDDVDDPPKQDLALNVDHVFESFVKPYLSKHEAEIDRTLMELKTRAGDSATLYCSRVLIYGQTRAFEILQMVLAQAYQRPQAPPV